SAVAGSQRRMTGLELRSESALALKDEFTCDEGMTRQSEILECFRSQSGLRPERGDHQERPDCQEQTQHDTPPHNRPAPNSARLGSSLDAVWEKDWLALRHGDPPVEEAPFGVGTACAVSRGTTDATWMPPPRAPQLEHPRAPALAQALLPAKGIT